MTTAYYKSARNYTRPQSAYPVHIPQPFLNYGGLSQMLKSDYQNPTKDTLDNKNTNIPPISYTKVPQPRALSAREEAQNTFWMTHINSSDIYHSFIKGTNPWARSSGFTQPLARTRGALGYYQNAHNNTMIYGFPGISSVQKNLLIEKERDKIENSRKIMERLNECGIRQYIVDKILKGCGKKGWIGLRSLKAYLRSISPHDCDIIDKNSFKFYLDKQGIRLDFNEVNEICEKFDLNKNDHINFVDFLNKIRYITEFRINQIDEFFLQVKEKEKNCVLFSKLNRIADMRFHPECMRY